MFVNILAVLRPSDPKPYNVTHVEKKVRTYSQPSTSEFLNACSGSFHQFLSSFN